jgi:hypothetical protein
LRRAFTSRQAKVGIIAVVRRFGLLRAAAGEAVGVRKHPRHGGVLHLAQIEPRPRIGHQRPVVPGAAIVHRVVDPGPDRHPLPRRPQCRILPVPRRRHLQPPQLGCRKVKPLAILRRAFQRRRDHPRRGLRFGLDGGDGGEQAVMGCHAPNFRIACPLGNCNLRLKLQGVPR